MHLKTAEKPNNMLQLQLHRIDYCLNFPSTGDVICFLFTQPKNISILPTYLCTVQHCTVHIVTDIRIIKSNYYQIATDNFRQKINNKSISKLILITVLHTSRNFLCCFHGLYISNYTIWILAQEFQTWGLCWQSHRNDKTYSPGSRFSGTSTKSLKAQCSVPNSSDGRLTLAHSDPSGLVPIFVLTIGWASKLSGLKGPSLDA